MRPFLALVLTACSTPAPTPEVEPEPAPQPEPLVQVDPAHQVLFAAIEAAPQKHSNLSPEVLAARIDLGKTLYYDARLSATDTISCNSCHQLDSYGVDGEPTSPGITGDRGGRNSPTVYNAAVHVAQFWDGRAEDVEAQAKGPILNPIEMGMPGEGEVLAKLGAIPGYGPLFLAAFPDAEVQITYDNLADAIGAFERTLVTPSRFDDYLQGDATALTAEERASLDLYVATGCTTCHLGAGLGGSMYMKLGLVQPYETEDAGRMEVTGNEADRHVFKVPSLRNVVETGPYLHDGSIDSLEETVAIMARHQLGKELTDEEVDSIVAFLKALTGEIPEGVTTAPAMPS